MGKNQFFKFLDESEVSEQNFDGQFFLPWTIFFCLGQFFFAKGQFFFALDNFFLPAKNNCPYKTTTKNKDFCPFDEGRKSQNK